MKLNSIYLPVTDVTIVQALNGSNNPIFFAQGKRELLSLTIGEVQDLKQASSEVLYELVMHSVIPWEKQTGGNEDNV
jgi:hypothetical protein